MATVLLFSDAVTSAYKDTSKALNEVELNDKKEGTGSFRICRAYGQERRVSI